MHILEILYNAANAAGACALCAPPKGTESPLCLRFLLTGRSVSFRFFPSPLTHSSLLHPSFFSRGYSSLAITREDKHNADLSGRLAGDVRVIYRDLIAFNSSGSTVNHKASRVARVSHACCRYDVITSISATRWTSGSRWRPNAQPRGFVTGPALHTLSL